MQCPVCDQPGGVMYGRFHPHCFNMMTALDEDLVREQLPAEVNSIVELMEAVTDAVRSVELTGDNVTDLGMLLPLIAGLRHETGLKMLNLHQHRNAIVARKVMMN